MTIERLIIASIVLTVSLLYLIPCVIVLYDTITERYYPYRILGIIACLFGITVGLGVNILMVYLVINYI